MTFAVNSTSGELISSYTLGAYSRDQVPVFTDTEFFLPTQSSSSPQLQQSMTAAVTGGKTVTEFYGCAIRKKLSKVRVRGPHWGEGEGEWGDEHQ